MPVEMLLGVYIVLRVCEHNLVTISSQFSRWLAAAESLWRGTAKCEIGDLSLQRARQTVLERVLSAPRGP